MSLRMGALYDALRTAQGVSDEDAKKAAEEIANYDTALADLRGDLKLVQWMLGFLIALMVGNLWLTVSILGRLGAR